MNTICPGEDAGKGILKVVNERIYVAIAIALTGAILLTLMSVFNLPV